MLGMVQSLNVSVASAIILTEARRQREQAGFIMTAAWIKPHTRHCSLSGCNLCWPSIVKSTVWPIQN